MGRWRRLLVFGPEEPVIGLAGAEGSWRGDDRRRPVVLITRSLPASYVAVWPADGPPPQDGELTERELAGVVLAQPVSHWCFVCGGEVKGLYVDSGLPFFGPGAAGHDWITGCPRCVAHVDQAGLHGLLRIG